MQFIITIVCIQDICKKNKIGHDTSNLYLKTNLNVHLKVLCLGIDSRTFLI